MPARLACRESAIARGLWRPWDWPWPTWASRAVGLLRVEVRLPGVLRVRAGRTARRQQVGLGMVNMPAVNRLQFGWCETDLDRHPDRSAADPYEPDRVAAFVRTGRVGRPRWKIVGSRTGMVIVAGRLTPGARQHYAAPGAWDCQLTDSPVQPDRPVNSADPPLRTTMPERGIADSSSTCCWGWLVRQQIAMRRPPGRSGPHRHGI